MKLFAKPLTLKQANEFVGAFHRHSIPTVGCKFAFGCLDENGKLVGVVICGRPVARMADDGKTLEVLRVCTDGTTNACSFLYGNARKIARLMGYDKVVTYTLKEESGVSLKAVGGRIVSEVAAGEWSCKSRPRKSQGVYQKEKLRWEL